MIDIVRLKELYKENNFSQKEVSEKTGISQTHLSQIESGKKNPSLLAATRLASAFGVPLDSLLTNPSPPSTTQ